MSWMTESTNSLLPRQPGAVAAVLTFSAAAHAAEIGRLEWAASLLATLDGQELASREVVEVAKGSTC